MVVTSSWLEENEEGPWFGEGESQSWAEYGEKLDYDISGLENIDPSRDSIEEDWPMEIGEGKSVLVVLDFLKFLMKWIWEKLLMDIVMFMILKYQLAL
ncbi:hypothetical protein PVK06_002614 [Gossypium arboreum]|uniref:Uncharacterized protein n=1 Tax=Gossypium arboreum TaxID=29729 RepID=A0ABR0R485_GOSAR|nr:hypothetical protein PVK06_002614 [Gossypium arboreum]